MSDSSMEDCKGSLVFSDHGGKSVQVRDQDSVTSMRDISKQVTNRTRTYVSKVIKFRPDVEYGAIPELHYTIDVTEDKEKHKRVCCCFMFVLLFMIVCIATILFYLIGVPRLRLNP